MDPHVQFDQALTALKDQDPAYRQLWNEWFRLRLGEQQHIVGLLEPPARTAKQIVDDCERLAREMCNQDGWQHTPEYLFRTSKNPRSQQIWRRAALAMEVLQNTDVENALAELTDRGSMNLYLVVKANVDPASAWDSCIIAAESKEAALARDELTEDDIDHITQIGTAEPHTEEGIVLSQKDY